MVPLEELTRHARRGCAWLLGVLTLLTLCPLAALGQETGPERSPRSEPAAAPHVEMDEPAEEPEVAPEKRRFLKRVGPQPVTPEQREEAERLRILAAKYGTDPTAIVGRLQLTSQYLDLAQGRKAPLLRAVLICRSGETTCSAWMRRSRNGAIRIVPAPPAHKASAISPSRSDGGPITRPNMPSSSGAHNHAHRLRDRTGPWQVYRRPNSRYCPVRPALGLLPDRGVHTTTFRRRRSGSNARGSVETHCTNQFVLGRAVVERCASGVAGRLGTECEK